MVRSRLAEFCGVRPESAIWLGVLNPLVLLHLIGDAHNDALMLWLMLLGVTLVLQRRAVAGVAAITLRALVKAPAALAFVIPIWSTQLTGPVRWMRAAQRTLGVAAVTALLVSAATGTGFGWVRALDTPTRARTWMSISTDLGFLFDTLGHWLAGFSVDEVRHIFWMVGLVLAAVVTMFLLRHSARIGPVLALGISLTVLVLAGPVVHPWYLLWGIVPLAAAATADRIRRLAAVGSAGMVLLVIPGGVRPGVPAFTGALLGAGSVFLFARLRCPGSGRDQRGRCHRVRAGHVPRPGCRVGEADRVRVAVVVAMAAPDRHVREAAGGRGPIGGGLAAE